MSDISYEFERFRHGANTVLSNSMFKKADAPSGGELIVRVPSASLVDAVEARYPTTVRQEKGPIDFRSH